MQIKINFKDPFLHAILLLIIYAILMWFLIGCSPVNPKNMRCWNNDSCHNKAVKYCGSMYHILVVYEDTETKKIRANVVCRDDDEVWEMYDN